MKRDILIKLIEKILLFFIISLVIIIFILKIKYNFLIFISLCFLSAILILFYLSNLSKNYYNSISYVLLLPLLIFWINNSNLLFLIFYFIIIFLGVILTIFILNLKYPRKKMRREVFILIIILNFSLIAGYFYTFLFLKQPISFRLIVLFLVIIPVITSTIKSLCYGKKVLGG